MNDNNIKVKQVKPTSITELNIVKYCEENTAGIMIKNINGFVIPPDK